MKLKNRNTPRLYIYSELKEEFVKLSSYRLHYIRNVLRLVKGNKIILFNGMSQEKECEIVEISNKEVAIKINKELEPLKESDQKITLIQGMPRSGVMDNIIQKVTELGIYEIYPIFTEFSIIKFKEKDIKKRLDHWEKVSHSACEQSGRHTPLKINKPQKIKYFLNEINHGDIKLVFHPSSTSLNFSEISTLKVPTKYISVIIGPEGGLSDSDLKIIIDKKFKMISLGPRLLRVETAAISACSLIKNKWGDL